MHRALVAVVVLASCGRDTSDTPVSSGNAPSTSGSAATSSSIIAESVRIAVCRAEPCGGDESMIRVYRDAAGAVKKLYRLYGRCSHNAGIYFDSDGTQTEVIPERPVEGPDDARALQARHDAQVGGLTVTDVILCRDGRRVPP